MENYKKFLGTERFGSLDGLRCLAILAVLWHHSGIQLESTLAHQGQMGVYLFFAISGFLITSLMIRERMRHGRIDMKAFYVRRSLRIFPLYYAMLILYSVVVFVMERGPDGAEFFANLPYFATYTSNYFVELDGRVIFFFAWSLATEEQFYLSWPWVERYLTPGVKMGVLCSLIAIVASTHFGLMPIGQDSIAYKVLWEVAPPILFGVLAAHVLHNPRGFDVARKVIGYRWCPPLILAAAIGALAAGAPDYVAYVALTALVVSCVIREDHWLARVLKWKPIVRVGIVSYGIYLMHMLTFNIVGRAIDNQWLAWILGIIIVYGVAELSFATFERFFLRLKDAKADQSLSPIAARHSL